MGINFTYFIRKVDQGFKSYGNTDMPFFGNPEKQNTDLKVFN